jgi:cell division protein FtsN
MEQLSEKGYSGSIEPPASEADVYRVSVGSFASSDEASQFQTRLQADGFPTFVKRVSGP